MMVVVQWVSGMELLQPVQVKQIICMFIHVCSIMGDGRMCEAIYQDSNRL